MNGQNREFCAVEMANFVVGAVEEGPPGGELGGDAGGARGREEGGYTNGEQATFLLRVAHGQQPASL